MIFEQFTYVFFQILITLLVALVYFAEDFQRFLAGPIYDFLKRYKNIIVGVYYVYLAYELYAKYKN
jgi:hypothetical protein